MVKIMIGSQEERWEEGKRPDNLTKIQEHTLTMVLWTIPKLLGPKQ